MYNTCQLCGESLSEPHHYLTKYHPGCAKIAYHENHNKAGRNYMIRRREKSAYAHRPRRRQHDPMLYLGMDYVVAKLNGWITIPSGAGRQITLKV
jgi:hypothetical protein